MAPMVIADAKSLPKPGPHQQQCRSNVRLRSIRQCCFDIVAGVDRALALVRLRAGRAHAGLCHASSEELNDPFRCMTSLTIE